MHLKQEAWILYLRAVTIEDESDIYPFWGRVSELQLRDVLWSEDVRNFICLTAFHKELDKIVVDEIISGHPDDEYLKIIEQRIVAATDKIFAESDFDAVGKRTTKGFRKNGIIYLTNIPDCIKDRFSINKP